ncbi:hypothetical protein LQ567_15155 [Niabella pedocola]|uniref:Uncharacterized protein n=1 Tax=Niabella pedocola TaxID=1752077 RepID=A0ABS8PW37_9BACT|nr:hypothetical protein [Niabella pedocola]MCD2424116.1 hypothetical protein [Niabella pedocola]
MKSILLITAFLLLSPVTNAQSRKAGKGQQDFLVVTTDTAKRKSAVTATGSKPAVTNRAVLQTTNRIKKN